MEAVRISPQLLAAAGSPTISFVPGDVIFREGDKADKMYVIMSGELEVHLQGMVVDTLTQGGTFGDGPDRRIS